MENRKVRNEFGLDESNDRDVQIERSKQSMPWILGAIALFAIFAVMIFGVPSVNDKQASQNPPPTTTGSATPPQ